MAARVGGYDFDTDASPLRLPVPPSGFLRRRLLYPVLHCGYALRNIRSQGFTTHYGEVGLVRAYVNAQTETGRRHTCGALTNALVNLEANRARRMADYSWLNDTDLILIDAHSFEWMRGNVLDVKSLAEQQLRGTKLEILVFGPELNPPSGNAHIASFQQKRQQIHDALITEGHSVQFGENVVDSSLPEPLSDPLLQEIVAMRAADMIIVLVASPGTIIEASTICGKRELCPKTRFYCFEEHRDGLVVRHVQHSVEFGATCDLVNLSTVQACHLTGMVLDKVRSMHAAKAFLF